MNISPKERFLDICHFKRRGDLYTSDGLSEQTLEKWVEQGAPKEIINPRFHTDYFRFQLKRSLNEINSGPFWRTGEKVVLNLAGPILPAYEPRFISEDERSVTYTNSGSQTVKRLKESLKTGWGMPMFLDWPVKDRATC